MTGLDWGIIAGFFLISIAIGTMFTKRAGQSLESYFVSNRQLTWWLAGSSMAATAFSSDTPLLLTGMVRRRGIWGAWEVWALAISTMLAVFVFSKLWKRANVMTEVELVERRYGGGAAAALRGFKAVYWGLFYNCYVMGAWPITGLRKVLEETTGASREVAIIVSVACAAVYTSSAGLWGVALTDLFQFIWAMAGAVLLAVFAVSAVGGLAHLKDALQSTPFLQTIPALPSAGTSWLESPFGWFMGLLLVQWWAWKNTDGGGIIVQRLVSCKDERQAMKSVLWFNVAQYALRSWPWILTALASLLLIPNDALQIAHGSHAFIDHERAYPRLIMQLLPAGLRGVMVASFFAAFLSTISTHLNWGASYLVNDGYKRFVNRRASERHYVRVSRLVPFGLALGAMAVAFWIDNIGQAFTIILNLTAGIGPVYLLRWFWWRINAWSEISAMLVSVPILLARPMLLAWLGWPSGLLVELLVMVLGTALIWVPVTLATPAVDRAILTDFYATVRPPGWWKAVAVAAPIDRWSHNVWQWLIGTVAVLTLTIGPLEVVVGQAQRGWWWCGVSAVTWACLWWWLAQEQPAREADDARLAQAKSPLRTTPPSEVSSPAS